MWIIEKIKKRRARKEFLKRCPRLLCATSCPYHIDDGCHGKCKIAIEVGLEDEDE